MELTETNNEAMKRGVEGHDGIRDCHADSYDDIRVNFTIKMRQ